ncbi:AAA family ATPase [Subtercola boreus]|uniref:ATP-binding protein n=1 Tax=Subtercola boreus TaxID=120213 RepID=A0A3E0W5G8_9MICO|nr:ATP-binding protein [Subtercola boreus]RFA17558.1 ATP-binding protein [Subtercola boreus]RFA17689.1 ATP-binding protein [Subtercola boreus]RFA24307.1 ATP-binding protein [Subtercola boreus]
MRNPFKPTAGARPPLLVGREDALDGFKEAINDGSGSPGLLTIFTGPRGVGKTVLLTAAEEFAQAQGWVVISETATTGLIPRLTSSMILRLEELGNGPPGRRLTAVTAGGFGVTTQLAPARQRPWRDIATQLVTVLDGHGTGLLITIDEIHAVNREELTELAAVIQHLIREDLPIGLLVAGIPKAVSDLLNEDVSTFLRRADRVDLKDVAIRDVEVALAATFADTDVTITPSQLRYAAEATGGYPFLIQLVGYHVWRRAVTGSVTDESLAEGIDAARRRLGSTVLQASLADLSQVDRTFLLKMADDDGPSKVADIASRLGENTKYAGVYRRRLIDAGVIVNAGRGLLDFSVPHLRQYLREHAASGIDSNTL